MPEDPILRLEGVSKRYLIREPRFVSRAARAALASWVYERKRELWALRDISIECRPGGMLGVIGLNGSGKSTLLKLIAGVSAPTEGRIETRGSMVGLLELGAGFHPDLTGYQNVFLQGNLIGLSKADINRRLEAIVEFSGLGPFMDLPVKRYSSGMYARLGFSLALHSDARIILIDEILAVGDADFQRRGLNRIREIQRQGDTILVVVTHNLGLAQEYCDEAIWLEDGRIRLRGEARATCEAYVSEQIPETLDTLEYGSDIQACERARRAMAADSPLRIVEVAFLDGEEKPAAVIPTGQTAILRIEVEARTPLEGLNVTALLVAKSQIVAAELQSAETGRPVNLPQGRSVIRFRLEPQLFLEGEYSATVLIGRGEEWSEYLAVAFRQGLLRTSHGNSSTAGYLIRHPHRWTALPGMPEGVGDGPLP